jgi:hypothetical protein
MSDFAVKIEGGYPSRAPHRVKLVQCQRDGGELPR